MRGLDGSSYVGVDESHLSQPFEFRSDIDTNVPPCVVMSPHPELEERSHDVTVSCDILKLEWQRHASPSRMDMSCAGNLASSITCVAGDLLLGPIVSLPLGHPHAAPAMAIRDMFGASMAGGMIPYASGHVGSTVGYHEGWTR